MLFWGCRSLHTTAQKPAMGASEVEYQEDLIQIPLVNPYFHIVESLFYTNWQSALFIPSVLNPEFKKWCKIITASYDL